VVRSAKVVLAALALVAGCTRADPSFDRSDGGAVTSASIEIKNIAPTASLNTTPSPARAWPLPLAARGVAVGPSASADPLRVVTGDAARRAMADRCPDHDECVRIANNEGDVAQATCDRECARCCLHENADECVRRECAGACRLCADAECRAAVCSDTWLTGCRDRCAAELTTCAGCRDAWCGDGAARRACHADAKALHAARLAACERDCKPADVAADGSCTITCSPKSKCSKAAKSCALGTSPDCRCECSAAVAGGCVAWNAVCVCG
jgi:hypothetical protein